MLRVISRPMTVPAERMALLKAGLSIICSSIPGSAFPTGAHVAEVEIDPDTGIIEVVKSTMVGDFGTVINPLLVEGQSHGGVVQGIGQALFERVGR